MKLTLIPPILTGLFLLISINTTQAGDLSYNYIEGGANHYLGDNSNTSSFKLDGSIDITEDFNLIAGLESGSMDVENIDIKINQYKLGAGMHKPVRSNMDFITEMALINATLSNSSWYNRTENAVMAGAGFRQRITDKLEGHAKINVYKILDSESDFEDNLGTEFIFGGRLHINEQLSGGLDYTQPDSGSDGILTTSIRFQSL